MPRALRLSTAVLLTLLTFLAMAGARERKKYKGKPEDTIYGTISCSIPPPPIAPGAQQKTADTIRDCLVRHGKAMIIEDGSQSGIEIENPDAVGDYEGHRVSISGYTVGESFHVVSLRVI